MARKPGRKKTSYDRARFERDYVALAPAAQRFATEVGHQLGELLDRGGISLSFPLQSRVKQWQSVAEKLERVPLPIGELRELQDLIGFRLILQFRRDIDRVCDLLGETFRVIEQYDTSERLKEDQFGYASIHYVIQLPSSWLGVPTMAEFGDFRAEIQVRTTAQHIWAAASHTLQYKNEAAVPPTLRRSIHRVSALLETVDLEFERLLLERDTYRSDTAAAQKPEEALNVDILEHGLDVYWPSANKEPGREDYSELLDDLLHFGISTRKQLAGLIEKHRKAVLQEDSIAVADARSAADDGAEEYDQERIARGVYFTHAGLTRLALAHQYGAEWQKYARAKFFGQSRNA